MLRKHFHESDRDGDGTMQREEFADSLPQMIKLFHDHDFHFTVEDLTDVFDLVDYDGGGTVDLDEFLDGVAAFTAEASDLPMHVLRLQANLRESARAMEDKLSARIQNVESSMKNLSDRVESWIETVRAGIASTEQRHAARIKALEDSNFYMQGLHAKMDKLLDMT